MTVPTIWNELMGTGAQERFYDAGGVRTRVLEAGEGPALLMLHGTGGHAEAYYRNLPALSQHFRVCSVDMLGHGYTDRPDVEYTLDDYAGHIEALLDAMGVERAFVSGESLGAAVTSWFGITRPHRIERAVLNTGILHYPDRLDEILEVGRRTRAIAEGGLTRETIRKRMEWLVSEPSRMTDELVECRYRVYSQEGMMERVGRIMQRMMRMLSGEVGHEYMAEGVMQRLTCPTLVLWTEHNPGQSVELATRLVSEMPDARIEVLTDAGHWPQFEQPELVNRLHLEFLGAASVA
jgi:2-hydroxy-6-oxonona-2,4-dienedioate hydrolase